MAKKKSSVLCFILFLFFYPSFLSARDNVSVTLISFEDHPRDVSAQVDRLKVLFPPETEIEYLRWSNPKAGRLLFAVGEDTVPQVIYEEGIEKKDEFIRLARNGVARKKGEKYVVPQETVLDILGRVKLFYKREKKPGHLDLFVMSACPYGVAAQKRIINYLRIHGLEEVSLRVRYLTKMDRDGTIYSARGEEELFENLRQLYVQESHPGVFFDYLLSINRENFLDYEGRFLSRGLDAEEYDDFLPEAVNLLVKDMDFSQSLEIFSSPSILWENRYLIDTHIPFLSSYPPFDKVETCLEGEKTGEKEEMEYFYALVCPPCEELEKNFLSPLREKYRGELKLVKYDAVNNPRGQERLKELEEEFGFLREIGVPAVYFRGHLMIGGKAIAERIEDVTKKILGEPGERPGGRRRKTKLHPAGVDFFFRGYLPVFFGFLFTWLLFLKIPEDRIVLSILGFWIFFFLSFVFSAVEIHYGLRFVFFVLFFSFFFLAGVKTLYEYYLDKELPLSAFDFLKKNRGIVGPLIFSVMLGGISGLFGGEMSRGESVREPLKWALILTVLSGGFIRLAGVPGIAERFRKRESLRKWLLALYFFSLAVITWIFK